MSRLDGNHLNSAFTGLVSTNDLHEANSKFTMETIFSRNFVNNFLLAARNINCIEMASLKWSPL